MVSRYLAVTNARPENGNVFVSPVENRTADTLLTIIKDWIKPGTTIISDCWKVIVVKIKLKINIHLDKFRYTTR